MDWEQYLDFRRVLFYQIKKIVDFYDTFCLIVNDPCLTMKCYFVFNNESSSSAMIGQGSWESQIEELEATSLNYLSWQYPPRTLLKGALIKRHYRHAKDTSAALSKIIATMANIQESIMTRSYPDKMRISTDNKFGINLIPISGKVKALGECVAVPNARRLWV